MAFDTCRYRAGVISTIPSGQPHWIRNNLLMSRDETESIHGTFECITTKSQIKFGLRDRQKFSRGKKAFYLYLAIDSVVQSRPTSKGEVRVRILACRVCIFSFISETCVESHWQFIYIFLSVFCQLVSGKIKFSSVEMIGDLPIS